VELVVLAERIKLRWPQGWLAKFWCCAAEPVMLRLVWFGFVLFGVAGLGLA
jgi:hypothetical protein